MHTIQKTKGYTAPNGRLRHSFTAGMTLSVMRSTSLTLIYGPCQKLLEFNTDDLVKKHLHTIKNNTYRMLKLIDELMVFRKIETDHLKLHPERLEVIELVKYLSDNFISAIEEEEITFSINAPAELFWVSDREALDKILFNILSNAVKYVDKKGLPQVPLKLNHYYQ